MSTNRVVGDALWRALCPSVDAAFLSKAVGSAWPPVGGGRKQCANGWRQTQHPGQTRAVHTSSPLTRPSAVQPSADAAAESPPPTLDGAPKSNSGFSGIRYCESNVQPVQPTAVDGKAKASPISLDRNSKVPNRAIYEGLRTMRTRKRQGDRIRKTVDYLVRERGEQPNPFLYEALVTANWDPTTGSAAELKAIMYEMRGARIEPSQGFYHSALRLLAVHPDYIARVTILKEMKEQGIELKDEGKCSVALAMLRENHYEMALDYLDQMLKDGTEIPGWVFDIFFYVLAKRGFIDESLQLLHQRLDKAEGDITAVPLAVWYYVLDECSRRLHYQGTRFIWEKLVQSGILNPSDGTALNVLNTASRHGDSALATEVIQLLSERQVKLSVHHYEALLDCYVQANDLENAFQVLCIMADAGIHPDQSSTRSIFLALKRTPERADEIVGILEALDKQHKLPVASINVLLEALTKAGEDTAKTLEVYHQLNLLCPPNQQTFAHLLEACQGSEAAGVLVAEMQRFSVRPSPTIIEHLVRCYALDGELDEALAHLAELSQSAISQPRWLSKETLAVVLERCCRDKDARMWAVAEEANKRQVGIDSELLGRMVKIGTRPEGRE